MTLKQTMLIVLMIIPQLSFARCFDTSIRALVVTAKESGKLEGWRGHADIWRRDGARKMDVSDAEIELNKLLKQQLEEVIKNCSERI